MNINKDLAKGTKDEGFGKIKKVAAAAAAVNKSELAANNEIPKNLWIFQAKVGKAKTAVTKC